MPNKKNKETKSNDDNKMLTFVLLSFVLFVIIDYKLNPYPENNDAQRYQHHRNNFEIVDIDKEINTEELKFKKKNEDESTMVNKKIPVWNLINFSLGLPALVTLIIFAIHEPFASITFNKSIKIKYKFIIPYLAIYFFLSVFLLTCLFYFNEKNKLKKTKLFEFDFLFLALITFLIVVVYHRSKVRFLHKRINEIENLQYFTPKYKIQKMILEQIKTKQQQQQNQGQQKQNQGQGQQGEAQTQSIKDLQNTSSETQRQKTKEQLLQNLNQKNFLQLYKGGYQFTQKEINNYLNPFLNGNSILNFFPFSNKSKLGNEYKIDKTFSKIVQF